MSYADCDREVARGLRRQARLRKVESFIWACLYAALIVASCYACVLAACAALNQARRWKWSAPAVPVVTLDGRMIAELAAEQGLNRVRLADAPMRGRAGR